MVAPPAAIAAAALVVRVEQGGRNCGRCIRCEQTRADGERGRGCKPFANQPLLQSFLAARQPALECSERPVQALRRLFVRDALETAEDDGQALSVSQAVDLVIDLSAELVVFDAVRMFHGDLHGTRRGLLARLANLDASAQPHGDAMGDAMEPASERIAISHGLRPPREDQERGLKRVFGKVRVVEQPPADAQDHRAVAFDERAEGRL